jgi:hypothetical protein
MRNGAGPAVDVAALGERARPVSLAREQVLPVLDELTGLLPRGLQRGTTVAVGGCAPTSLALALAAGASAAGSWSAVLGMPSLGLAAAAELGVDLDRLVLVGPVPAGQWSTVVATLAEAFDVVLTRPPGRAGSVRPGDARRVAARLRERGSVLVQVGWPSRTWPERTDLEVDARPRAGAPALGWEGIGEGHGHLQARAVTLEARGRRGADRPRRADVWLPGPDGRLTAVAPTEVAPVIPVAGPVAPARPSLTLVAP